MCNEMPNDNYQKRGSQNGLMFLTKTLQNILTFTKLYEKKSN